LSTDREFIETVRGALRDAPNFVLKVRGTSMHPFIRDGETVVISKLDPVDLGVGDVVACSSRSGERFFVHRVVGIERGYDGALITVKGDRTPACDGMFWEKEILGVVTSVIGTPVWRRRDNSLWRLQGRVVAFLSLRMPVFWRWSEMMSHSFSLNWHRPADSPPRLNRAAVI
jgi:signal peptidase I